MNRPPIVCLCGSTRFFEAFQEANYRETIAGRIVLSVGFFMHAKINAHGQNVGITDEDKARLDDLHLAKIDLADEVLIINVGDYIGDSTKREAWYALRKDKRVRLWEQPSRWTHNTLSTMFTGWDDWLKAAKAAATTKPSSISPHTLARDIDQ